MGKTHVRRHKFNKSNNGKNKSKQLDKFKKIKHKKHEKQKKISKSHQYPHQYSEDIDQIEEFDEYDEYDESDDNFDDNFDDDQIDEEERISEQKITDKDFMRLKEKIMRWLDNDDKIKEMNQKIKKYKDTKKEQEKIIIEMITKMGVEDKKIDVHDENQQLKGRVYRHKSVTKGAIKEDIIKKALMEAIRDEKKVDQLVKKIDSKRSITERYYLKRTKGNKEI